MNPSFRFLRQVPSVTRRISVSQKSGIHHHQQPFGLLKQQSFFSTQPEKAICYEDLVKETLKKMVAERVMESSTTKEIADLDLERRFQHYDVSTSTTVLVSRFSFLHRSKQSSLVWLFVHCRLFWSYSVSYRRQNRVYMI